MEKHPGNFVGDIHAYDYTGVYEAGLSGYEGLLMDGRDAESLDGLWNYGVDPYDTCLRATWYKEKYKDADGRPLPVDFSFDQWPVMRLPCCWNTQAEKLFLYEGPVVFTRTFRYAPRGDERVFLKIGAANHVCRVFLNGVYIGMHRGGNTPFCLEMTGRLCEENRLLIVVDNRRRPEQVPCENTDWFNYGGIYRSVSLLRLPQIFVREFFARLVPDGKFDKVAVTVRLSDAADGEAVFRLDELGVRQAIPVFGGKGSAVISVPSLSLWSPDSPKLYGVSVAYGDDLVRDRVGFREIRAEGQSIALNGAPLYLKGVSCHEDSQANGKALTEAEIRQNLLLAREMGCNFMRLAHYPHSELTARLADEMGMLLWEEIPVYWAIDFANEATYRDAENQLGELIHRDQNRASVILWSVGNENADTAERLSFMSRLAAFAREQDGTRLVTAACMVDHAANRITDRLIDALDVIGINEYCGWYTPDFAKLPELFANSAPKKPVIISEFGADARAGHHGTKDDMGTEECQAEIYKKQIQTLSGIPYVRGMTPWILHDFRCPRRLHVLQDFYNIKGLCTADRARKKQAFFVMQAFYRQGAGE